MIFNAGESSVRTVNGQTGDVVTALARSVTLAAASWSNKTQSATVQGVTTTSNIIVTPAPSDINAYAAADIRCTSQTTNSLTFTCTTVPSSAISVNVLIV